MKTNNVTIQDLIDYLEKKLVLNGNGFTKISPRCFLCIQEVDKIFVYVRDDNILIVNDGENVIDGMDIIRLNLHESDPMIFDHYLQEILSLF